MTEDGWRIVGGSPLHGRVRAAGSKNGSLPTLAAALLADGKTVLHGVPRIADVETMLALLRAFGLEVEWAGAALEIVNRGLATHRAPEDLVRRMRASHYILAPVLARLGRVEVPLPGGCDIGQRPVDYILSGLESLGVDASVRDDRIEASAKRLRGARVTLDPAYRSPGATFSLLMAASLAEGVTVIENASCEPDVVSFCRFLRCAGAQIETAEETTLIVTGVDRLQGAEHSVNADRLEAGTLLCAAASTRGEVWVEGVPLRDLGRVADVLRAAGVEVREDGAGVCAACPGRPRAIAVATQPYPGFPTDLQPPLAAGLATAEGTSKVTETIFDRRLQYAQELVKMGARIDVLDSRNALIHGVPRLHGATVEAQNIRDGAALVVAALGAEGESAVMGKRYIARGYERLAEKLRALGAQIDEVAAQGDAAD